VGARAEVLVDVEGAVAIRDRLRASLAGPGAPSPQDAALAVLIYCGRLWNWAALEAHSTEDIRIMGKRQPAATPLKRRAQALAEGRLRLDQDTVGALAGIAKAIDHEYVNDGD